MAFLILKKRGKNLFLAFFAILFFVLSFWANGVLRAEAAGEIYCSDSWAPASPCVSNAEDCVFCSGFVSTCTVNAANFNIFTILVNNLASCSSGDSYCQTAKCPADNANFFDGDNCTVRILDGGNVVESSFSHWDKSEGKCIQCNGNLQYSVCGSTTGLFLSPLGPCVGMSAFDNKLDFACNAAVVSQCDEKAVGAACSPPVGGTCSAAGLCVAANALSLEINLGTNPVSIGGTSTVTFTVKKDGVAESGATVSITSISCGSLPNPGLTTDASGQTTSTFTAPGATNICVVNAKAAKAGFTDGVATVSIPVSMCAGSDYVEYNNDIYVKGESIQLEGVLNAGGLGEWSLCIYNPGGSLKEDDMFSLNPAFPRTVNYTSDAVGSWKGLLTAGLGTCPGAFNAAAGCLAATDVVECEDDADCASNNCDSSTYTCVAGGGGGGGGGVVSSPLCQAALIASDVGKTCGAYTAVAADVGGFCCSALDFVFIDQTDCQNSDLACAGGGGGGAEICTGGADEDGDLDVDCADSDCAADPACVAGAASCSGPGMFVSPLGPGYCTIGEILTKATNWILALVSSIIILIIIIGGLMYISSAGDEEKLRTSKNIIFYAIVGLGIILISYALITEVTNILKGP